jgi:hydroxyquinol 1,2-dioxygenase
MVFGGVFDDFPDAKLIVGHMGEGLPYILWRSGSRWAWHNHHGIELARGNPSEYLRHNLCIATSGACDFPLLLCAMLAMGADHILFSADYPLEDLPTATAFLRSAPISEGDRAKIAHGNAERLPPMDFTEENAAAAVMDSFRNTPNPRLRELLSALVKHLHAFVRETRLTLPEWEAAIRFLTEVGQKCDDTRQEFILQSDVLGVSMLTETINGQHEGTESTVLGPFHMTESPARTNGESIDMLGGKVPCAVSGHVLDPKGAPLANATVDVWQCAEEGFYDVQHPDVQPPGNGRGLFHTEPDGSFWFRTVVSSYYPIPTDGPVGRLLQATLRHPHRPAHIHFIAAQSPEGRRIFPRMSVHENLLMSAQAAGMRDYEATRERVFQLFPHLKERLARAAARSRAASSRSSRSGGR